VFVKISVTQFQNRLTLELLSCLLKRAGLQPASAGLGCLAGGLSASGEASNGIIFVFANMLLVFS
jgi:hypothetical protein